MGELLPSCPGQPQSFARHHGMSRQFWSRCRVEWPYAQLCEGSFGLVPGLYAFADRQGLERRYGLMWLTLTFVQA